MSKAISNRRFGVMTRAAIVLALGAVTAFFCGGCGGGDGNPSGPGTTPGTNPGGGGSYSGPIVTIGSQKWMGKNLDRATANSKCYENSPDSCAKYGRLYTWSDAKTACPSGWHLLTDDEWTQLMNYVRSNGSSAGVGTKLKSSLYWNSYSGVPAGTDEFGFAALPGGLGDSVGNFGNAGNYGYWWSAAEIAANYAYCLNMRYNTEGVSGLSSSKTNLLSVRCVANQ